MKNKPINPALLQRCKLAVSKAGGYTKLGKAIGCSPQSVYKWQVVPFNRCVAVAEFIGWQPWDIRPDIFVKEDADASLFDFSNTKAAARTKPKMDRKAAAGSKAAAIKRRNGGKRRAGNGNRQKSGARKDLSRPGNVANGMVQEAENVETLPA